MDVNDAYEFDSILHSDDSMTSASEAELFSPLFAAPHWILKSDRFLFK